MARSTLGDMLATIKKPEEAPAAPAPAPEQAQAPAPVEKAEAATPPPATPSPKTSAPRTKRTTTARATSAPAKPRQAPSPTEERPTRIEDLERKEVRIRPDQYEDLTRLSRALNRKRGGQGHRLTENTLIRLGIDLLLKESATLEGASEAALAKHLGL